MVKKVVREIKNERGDVIQTQEEIVRHENRDPNKQQIHKKAPFEEHKDIVTETETADASIRPTDKSSDVRSHTASETTFTGNRSSGLGGAWVDYTGSDSDSGSDLGSYADKDRPVAATSSKTVAASERDLEDKDNKRSTSTSTTVKKSK